LIQNGDLRSCRGRGDGGGHDHAGAASSPWREPLASSCQPQIKILFLNFKTKTNKENVYKTRSIFVPQNTYSK